jgi:RimJ/RimL family protein N-acetyltransferase
MRLRLLEQRDLERVRELRNRNRSWFFDDAEITAEQQQRWFESLPGRPLRFYVIEEDGAVAGTISVTETREGNEIGNLILDEAYRGRGLMTQAVARLTEQPGRYFSRVKTDNAASVGVFLRAGFTEEHVVLSRDVE